MRRLICADDDWRCWLGSRCPALRVSHRRLRRRRARRLQPRTAAAPTASRSLFEPTWRQFQVGGTREQHRRRSGALSALPGPPRRRALHRRALRARMAQHGTGCSARPPTTSAGAISDSSATTNGPAASRVRTVGPDPAVLQRRHEDALHAGGDGTLVLRRRDAASDPERAGEPERLCADRAAVRSARAARHRPRDVRRPRRRRTSTSTATLHDAAARRRTAVGRQLRLQQRRRGAAARTTRATNDFTIGAEWTNSEHAARGLQRIVVRQPRRDARLGQPAPADDRPRAPGPRAHGALAVELGADDELRRLHEVRAEHAAHGLRLLRLVEQRRAAAAVHHQLGAARDCAPARDGAGRSERVFDQPELRVAPGHRLAVRRALPAVQLRQSEPARRASRSTSPTTRRSAPRHGRAGAVCPQPHDLRRRRDVDGLSPLALAVGYTRNSSGYDFRIFESTGENVVTFTADAVGIAVGDVPGAYEFADRSGSGLDEALLVEIGEQPALRHYDFANRTRQRFTGQVDILPERVAGCSAARPASARTTTTTATSACRKPRSALFGFGADYQQPDGFGAAPATTTSAMPVCSDRDRRHRRRRRSDPLRDWTADSTERVHYFSIYPMPPRIGPPPKRGSATTLLRTRQLRVRHRAGRPAAAPVAAAGRVQQAAAASLDVRHRLSSRLAATVSYLYEPFRVYDFAFDPTVVNGIVQPSSLVLGYVYRPYTAHSAVFGLMYFW